jgi:hypothetical protein
MAILYLAALSKNSSDQPFDHQSWSKRLSKCNPLQSGKWWRHAFSLPCSPELQKVGENKTVGLQYVWG